MESLLGEVVRRSTILKVKGNQAFWLVKNLSLGATGTGYGLLIGYTIFVYRLLPFLTNMRHSKLKLFVLNLQIAGSHQPCLRSSSKNPLKLWNSVNKLPHRKPVSQLPSNIESKSLPSMFASFFSDKVLKIHSALKLHFNFTSPHTEPSVLLTNPPSSVLLQEKKSASSSRSHPTLSVILILYLLLFWNNVYLHSYPL